MVQSSAPLEGVVVIVVDAPEQASQIEKALSQAGAAVFVAHDQSDIQTVLTKVAPHFAVIDPTAADGTGPASGAWMLFSHPKCRTIIYSSSVHAAADVETKWLIGKDRPVSDVVDTILLAVRDPVWVLKGGDDVKPAA